MRNSLTKTQSQVADENHLIQMR